MKKLILLFVLMSVYLFNAPLAAHADTIKLDFNKVFQHHGSVMLIIDQETNAIMYANEAASDFYGYKIEQLESMSIDKIHILTPEETEKEMQAAVDQKRNHFIFKHRLASGEIRTVEVYSYPCIDGDKTLLVSIIQDITVSTQLAENSILMDVLNRNYKSTQEQLDHVLNETLNLTESKVGYIYIYSEENQEFIINSWSKDVMAECTVVEKLTKYRLEKTGLWGEVVRQRKPIIVNDFEMPNSMKKGYPEGHVQLSKFMSIPVFLDNEIVAVVGLANKEDDYDETDIYQVTVLMNGVWNAKERREQSNC